MKVVHLKKEEYSVYIGRAGHGEDGTFGNPVKLNEACCVCKERHETRGSTLLCYELYLRCKLQSSTAFYERFMTLTEEDILGCFCKPDACHGDVIIKVWKEMND